MLYESGCLILGLIFASQVRLVVSDRMLSIIIILSLGDILNYGKYLNEYH